MASKTTPSATKCTEPEKRNERCRKITKHHKSYFTIFIADGISMLMFTHLNMLKIKLQF